MLELAAEVLAARGIVEGERRQGVDHSVASGRAAVTGFDADDRDDVFGRHTALGGDAFERFAVLVPELRALGNSFIRQEAVVVLPPGGHLFSRPGHEIDDLRLRLRLRKQAEDGFSLQRVAGDHVVHEAHDLGTPQIEATPVRRKRGLRGDGRKHGCEEDGDVTRGQTCKSPFGALRAAGFTGSPRPRGKLGAAIFKNSQVFCGSRAPSEYRSRPAGSPPRFRRS